MITSGFATLKELQSVYSVRDLYQFLEIILINQYNEMIASEYIKRKSELDEVL